MAKMPSIGQLRERLVIQARSEQPTSQGRTTEAFTTVMEVWGKIMPVSYLTRIDTAQINTPLTHKAWIRNVGGINTRQWIVWDGRRFNIKSAVAMEEGPRFLELALEEIGAS